MHFITGQLDESIVQDELMQAAIEHLIAAD